MEIKLQCGYSALVDPKTLQPNPKNPKEHPPQQIELYKKIIIYQGFRSPVVVSKQSGLIVTGHGLTMAAIELGLQQVPVEYQDFENEAMELAHLAADNKLADQAVTNASKLSNLIQLLDTGSIDLEVLGLPLLQIENLMIAAAPLPTPPAFSEGGEDRSVEPGEAPHAPPTDVEQIAGEPPPSHVRMVQLFLNDQNIVEFQQLVQAAQERFKVSNVTDAIFAALRHLHGSSPAQINETTSA